MVRGRIPNQLILTGLFLGFVYQIHQNGSSAAPASLLGIIFPIILLYPVFILKGLGAGDIKLFAVIGCFLGITQYEAIFILIALSFFCGAVQSIILMCLRRRILSTIHFTIPIFISAIFYMEGFY